MLLQLSVALLAMFSAGAAKADISELTGFYKLSSARVGMCDPEKMAFTSLGLDGETWEIWVGEFLFVEPFGKRVGVEDDVSTDIIRADFHPRELVRTTWSRDNVNGGTSAWTVRVTWNGRRMTITSYTHGEPSSWRACSYRKVSSKSFAPGAEGYLPPRRSFDP